MDPDSGATPLRDTTPDRLAQAREELFEDLGPAGPGADGPRKPFADYVRETPAEPLSGGVKALLWAAAIVVALILVAALTLGPRPRGKGAGAERAAAADRRG